MHTPEQLLVGLVDDDWRVRHQVVDRLAVRAEADDRIVPALVAALRDDPAWKVRDAVAMRLHEFDSDQVIDALRRALHDSHPEVRSSASFSLAQLGEQ
jgi:HEAT repeat protein